MQAVTRLSPDGANFLVWERQLKALICDVTGVDLVYLDRLLISESDDAKSVDHYIRSMVFFSIDESFHCLLELDMPASQAFRQLKQICAIGVHGEPLDVESAGVQDLSDSIESASGSPDGINISDLEALIIKLEIQADGLRLTWSDFPDAVIKRILHIVRLSSHSAKSSTYRRKNKNLREVTVYPTYDGPSYKVYQDPETPTLTSFQSLASVDRRTYEFSRPFLWKVSPVAERLFTILHRFRRITN